MESSLAHETKESIFVDLENSPICVPNYIQMLKHLNPAFYGFQLIILMLLKPFCGCLQKLEVKGKIQILEQNKSCA